MNDVDPTRHDNGRRDKWVVLAIMLLTFVLIFGFAIYALTQTNPSTGTPP